MATIKETANLTIELANHVSEMQDLASPQDEVLDFYLGAVINILLMQTEYLENSSRASVQEAKKLKTDVERVKR